MPRDKERFHGTAGSSADFLEASWDCKIKKVKKICRESKGRETHRALQGHPLHIAAGRELTLTLTS